MAGPEEVDHPSGEDGLAEEICRLLDDRGLLGDGLQELLAPVQVVARHGMLRTGVSMRRKGDFQRRAEETVAFNPDPVTRCPLCGRSWGMILRSAFAALALVSMISTALWAQQPPPSGPGGPRPESREGGPGGPGGPGGRGGMMRVNPLVQALDADKDGEISADEIAKAPAALKTLDKNGDGKLSGDEIRPNPGGMGGERGGPRADTAEAINGMMAFDKNGDGKLSADELPERMRGIVARADTNKDGFATRDELTQALAARGAGRPGGGHDDHDDRPRRGDVPKTPPAN